MPWICASCGAEHDENDPPCRQCAGEQFAELVPRKNEADSTVGDELSNESVENQVPGSTKLAYVLLFPLVVFGLPSMMDISGAMIGLVCGVTSTTFAPGWRTRLFDRLDIPVYEQRRWLTVSLLVATVLVALITA